MDEAQAWVNEFVPVSKMFQTDRFDFEWGKKRAKLNNGRLTREARALQHHRVNVDVSVLPKRLLERTMILWKRKFILFCEIETFRFFFFHRESLLRHQTAHRGKKGLKPFLFVFVFVLFFVFVFVFLHRRALLHDTHTFLMYRFYPIPSFSDLML